MQLDDIPVSHQAFYWGHLTAVLFAQADLDTKANHDHDASHSPVLRVRLPKEFYDYASGDFVPFNFEHYLTVLRDEDEGGITYILADEPDRYGERIIHIAGTEGYLGVPDDFESNVYP